MSSSTLGFTLWYQPVLGWTLPLFHCCRAVFVLSVLGSLRTQHPAPITWATLSCCFLLLAPSPGPPLLVTPMFILSHCKAIEPNYSVSGILGKGKNYPKEKRTGQTETYFKLLHFMYQQLVFPSGYEVHGMEKIPEGPALIIFYHGAIPIDFYYFMAKIFIHKGRTCRVVADHFVFKIPGKA